MHYTEDWETTRQAVFVRDRERCANCQAPLEKATLDVHHIVPRGRRGSNRLSNLILLCRRCHDAAHGRGVAPAVTFYTNGQMTTDEFDEYHQLMREFKDHRLARFDSDEGCWYIPKSDVKLVVSKFAS
jgi:hypothetical protein